MTNFGSGGNDANGVYLFGEADDIGPYWSDAFNKPGQSISTLLGPLVGTGQVMVKPTSTAVVTGTTSTSTLGKVTFTGASSISLNGVFSSLYDDYLIKVKMTSHVSTVDTDMRLRALGTDSTATNYSQQRLTGTASTAASNNLSTQGLWTIDAAGIGATVYDSSDIDLEGPFLTAQTVAKTRFSAVVSTTSLVTGSGTMWNSATTSYDGFTLFVASGTMTGTIRVFGINNG